MKSWVHYIEWNSFLPWTCSRNVGKYRLLKNQKKGQLSPHQIDCINLKYYYFDFVIILAKSIKALATSPILAYPVFIIPFKLFTDASYIQCQEGQESAILSYGRDFANTEKIYSTT